MRPPEMLTCACVEQSAREVTPSRRRRIPLRSGIPAQSTSSISRIVPRAEGVHQGIGEDLRRS